MLSHNQLSLNDIEDIFPNPIIKPGSLGSLDAPSGYKGLTSFHKYWGKKPVECLSYLINLLTEPNDIVVDPFLGSGLVAREAILASRRFIGIDINPIAVEMSRLILELPDLESLKKAVADIKQQTQSKIDETYLMKDGEIATHYLWNEKELQSVWRVSRNKEGRKEFVPNLFDLELAQKYQSNTFQYGRPLHSFHNSRINTTQTFSFDDLFTGRALHNIGILLDAIYQQPKHLQNALLLSLTSASGQMSKMVFAISRRGKTTNTLQASDKIEVGSWVIGYWRPKLHFEIHAGNCFHNRVSTLIKALPASHSKQPDSISTNSASTLGKNTHSVLNGDASSAILEGDSREWLATIPSNSVSLVITDPPHSDRIPYLELSEMWNAILGKKVCFEKEIVVSNARGRDKTKSAYTKDMQEFLCQAIRILKPSKFLAVLFNARDSESWESLSDLLTSSKPIRYLGCFPMNYSATSVVQDNRKGSLKSDYVLIYQKCGEGIGEFPDFLRCIPSWTDAFPQKS